MAKETQPKAKAKKGLGGKARKAKVTYAKSVVASAAQSADGPAMLTETGAVETAIEKLGDKEQEGVDLAAEVAKNDAEQIAAEAALDKALTNYTNKGNDICDGDGERLTALGLALCADRVKTAASGPAEKVTDFKAMSGAESGSIRARWPRVASAFQLQYRLEPTAPVPAGAAAPVWQPVEPITTAKLEWTFTGLPPAATVGLRIRAVGAEVGPWSDEILAKAR